MARSGKLEPGIRSSTGTAYRRLIHSRHVSSSSSGSAAGRRALPAGPSYRGVRRLQYGGWHRASGSGAAFPGRRTCGHRTWRSAAGLTIARSGVSSEDGMKALALPAVAPAFGHARFQVPLLDTRSATTRPAQRQWARRRRPGSRHPLNWRSGPESNRHPRICSPMHHHSATGPPVMAAISCSEWGWVKPARSSHATTLLCGT